MLQVQTRTFRRVLPYGNEQTQQQAIDAVTFDVNTFMASLPFDRVLDYHSTLAAVSKYGDAVAYVATVVFLDEV
jgi:hypothetical protein